MKLQTCSRKTRLIETCHVSVLMTRRAPRARVLETSPNSKFIFSHIISAQYPKRYCGYSNGGHFRSLKGTTTNPVIFHGCPPPPPTPPHPDLCARNILL